MSDKHTSELHQAQSEIRVLHEMFTGMDTELVRLRKRLDALEACNPHDPEIEDPYYVEDTQIKKRLDAIEIALGMPRARHVDAPEPDPGVIQRIQALEEGVPPWVVQREHAALAEREATEDAEEKRRKEVWRKALAAAATDGPAVTTTENTNKKGETK